MTDTKPYVIAVDDDPLILRFLQIALDRAGYRSAMIEDPAVLMKEVQEDPPDLILLDLRMPGINGFDLFERLRQICSVPVIFLSASNRSEDRRQALSMGASEYIVKPFSPPDLLATINGVLHK